MMRWSRADWLLLLLLFGGVMVSFYTNVSFTL
jgi:hypothetical protein